MLDMGFEPQIKELINYLPSDRQTALYTAAQQESFMTDSVGAGNVDLVLQIE